MKHKLQKNKEMAAAHCEAVSSELQSVDVHLKQVEKEYHRVTSLSKSPMILLNDIDRQFTKATKLDGIDMRFLFLATALQCLRQYLLTPMTPRVDDQTAAKKVKGEHKESSDRIHRLYNPSLEEIITNPVPFDANVGSNGALAGYGALGHRGATIGHDPIMGIVFGTANIATSTLTTWKMKSYHITTGTVSIGNGRSNMRDVFGADAKTDIVLDRTFKVKLLEQGLDGKVIVGASLTKELQHLRSDVHSKDSLPIPMVSAIDPVLAGKLAKRGFDMANVLDIGKQSAYAMAIDILIAMIHGMFYDAGSGLSQSMYEIRTRRILVYSNLIASVSNVIATLVAECLHIDASRYVDWGGYANTLRRIVFDTKFIREIKRDFLKNELHERVVGTEYDFMEDGF